MLLILEIKQNKIRLELASGKKKSDKAEWKENNSLSRLLLSKIDEMLRKNRVGLDPAPISQAEDKGDSLFKNTKLANHGAGRKGWAIRPTRRGRYPQRNWCGVDKISRYKIISDVPENWTSARIAEITLKSLALAKKISL